MTEPDVVEPSAPVTLTPAPPVKRRETPAAARAAAPAPASPAPPARRRSGPAAPVLQMTPNTGAAEQRIYTLLATAQRNLENVSYHALARARGEQYDQAKGFIRMAHDALKIKNYSYAEKLASKAEAVASLLPKS